MEAYKLALNSIIKLLQTENTWRSKIEVNECIKLIETNGKKYYTDKEFDLLMNTNNGNSMWYGEKPDK